MSEPVQMWAEISRGTKEGVPGAMEGGASKLCDGGNEREGLQPTRREHTEKVVAGECKTLKRIEDNKGDSIGNSSKGRFKKKSQARGRGLRWSKSTAQSITRGNIARFHLTAVLFFRY